ncbi:MAG: transporter associated domain-containing protein [Bacteroidota bacterium]
MADVVSTRTNIDEPSKNLFQIIGGLSDISVKDVLIPRMNITALDIATSFEKLFEEINRTQYSYIPIYEDNMDNILGIIRTKDLLVYLTTQKSSKDFRLSDYIDKPLFVPETNKVVEVIKQFQSTRIHCAIVVDEHGGTVGIITLRDIITHLISDYKTILQPDSKSITELNDTTLLVSGAVPVEEVERKLNISLDIEDVDISTIGGFVFHLAGRIPDKGEKFKYKNLIFEPVHIKQNRIDELTITLIKN